MDRPDPTTLLRDLASGDAHSPDRLVPLVYHELRALARVYLKKHGAVEELQPTELVHEAYLKLIDQTRVVWQDRAHFLAIGAQAMRRLVVDQLRHRRAAKRGGDWRRVTLDERFVGREHAVLDLTALSEALMELAELSPRQHQIVLYRFFSGMSHREMAEVLGLSTRTVEDDWRMARAWMRRKLTRDSIDL